MKHLKTIFRGILCAFLALLLANPTSAISNQELNYFNSVGAFYYDPDGRNYGFSSGTGCYTGSISIAGGNAAAKIWSGLTSFLTPVQAAGIMGNMNSESGLNPVKHEYSQKDKYWNNGFDIVNDSSEPYGIGLIQWSRGRRTGMLHYIQEKSPELLDYFMRPDIYNGSGEQFLQSVGETVYDSLLTLELEYLKYELETYSSYRGIFDQTNVQDASDYFLEHVEIPNNIEATKPGRRAAAQRYYDMFYGTTNAPSNTTTCFAIGGNGDINATALRLAWPAHEEHSKDNPTPAYQAALNSVIGDFSTQAYPVSIGASCDAFVATVMRASGADPNFYCCRVTLQEDYLAAHPELYQRIGNIYSSADVQPGDILIANDLSHIELAVEKDDGTIAIASASLNDRTGELGNWYHYDGRYHNWRFIGKNDNITRY